MKTKLLTLLFALIASVVTLFASDTQVDGIWYDFDNNTLTASVTYRGDSYFAYENEYTGSVVIPSSVTYNSVTYSVTSIGENAFFYCYGLTSIEIPNSVTSIGESAFYKCYLLLDVTIPNSVTSIGNYAFSMCTSLPIIDNIRYADTYLLEAVDKTQTSYSIKDGTKWIGASAFSGCYSLTSTEIPNSVTSIGNGAFRDCSDLTSITIGNSVTNIGESTFSGCDFLTRVSLNSNALVGRNYTQTFNLKSIFGSQVKEYIIGDSVNSIGDYAFFKCDELSSITLPNSITSIGKNAFLNCTSLTSLTFPSGVKDIKARTCQGCSSLASIILPSSATKIGVFAFTECSSLTSITIPNTVKTIGKGTFYGCSSLKSVEMPMEINSIEDSLFMECSNLTSIEIPYNVNVLGNNAFYGCSSLTSIEIPNSVTSIGNNAFYGCSDLTSVTIGNNVTSIGNSAFWGCAKVTNIEIPNSVTSIGHSAFYGCSSLTSIKIPNGVTSIGHFAFRWCSNLTSVTLNNNVTSIGNGAFEGCSGLMSLEIPNSVKSISEGAFSYCSGLTNVTIPNSVTSIENNAFYGCSNLTSVTIGNSVTSIGNSAFSGCSNIKHIIWNAKNCNGYNFGSQVENFIWGDEVEAIPADLCNGMYLLNSISIPNSVTSIGNNAFYGCTGLTSVVLPNRVTSVGNYAFYGCSGLTSVAMGHKVTSVESYTFYGCTSLTSIEIPYGVKTIGNSAFSGCDHLKDIIIHSSVEEIGSVVFTTQRIENFYNYSETPQYMSEDAYGMFLGTLRSVLALAKLYVPEESIDKYKEAEFWHYFGQILPIQTPEEKGQIIEYNISVSVNDERMGSVTGEGTYMEGDLVSLEAIPNAGYRFLGWSNGRSDNPYSFVATKDVSITAIFEETPHYTIFWNMSEDAFNNLDSIFSTITINGLTICATPTRWMVVDASNQHIDNLEFTHRIKFLGSGKADSRYMTFNVDGDCTIDIYAKSGSQEVRELRLDVGNFGSTNNEVYPITGANITKETFKYEGEATSIYLYSVNKGVNIYAIRVTYGNVETGIEELALSDEQVQKILRDGQIFILRGDKMYTITGQEVK